MNKLLVIDDDRTVLRLVQKAFHDTTIEVLTCDSAEAGLGMIRHSAPDVLLLDIMLPGVNGIELALQIRQLDPKLPMIFVTASDDSELAIEAMKLGAYEYLMKPLDIRQIQELVERALETRRLMLAPVTLHDSDELPVNGDVLVGRSPAMLEVYKQIGRVAGQDVAVLIRGESGTGKELIARAIYQHGARRDKCYLAVNCAALTDTLLESELFGHEKGAFTGADRQHIGKFEQCKDGTIFLDEVGDMSPLTQSKVLRLLEEKKFERVGGKETISVDSRIISATNRPLEEMIEQNQFRLDLLHRLNAFEIHLPPLRERGADVELLINHFLTLFNHQLHKNVTGISPEAIELLNSYDWPGNVRELQSVIRKVMLMSTGPVIVPDFLPTEILGETPPRTNGEATPRPSAPINRPVSLNEFIDRQLTGESRTLYSDSLSEMERYLLCRVLQRHSGNQSRAAQQLGITRGSLRNKIRSLGISIEQVVTGGHD
jgi:two-component system nitrogen regulation response regulator GlnG